MKTITFSNRKTPSDPNALDLTPDVPGTIEYFAHVARTNDVEREFAVAALVDAFCMEPTFARDLLDTVTERERAPDARACKVTREPHRMVVEYDAPEGWTPRISPAVAAEYWRVMKEAVERARGLDERASDPEATAATERTLEPTLEPWLGAAARARADALDQGHGQVTSKSKRRS